MTEPISHWQDDPDWDEAEDGGEDPDPQQWIARFGFALVAAYVAWRLLA